MCAWQNYKDIQYSLLLVTNRESDYLMISELCNQLQGMRISVDWVSNFQNGLHTISVRPYNFYLFDYHVDNYNGLDLLHAVNTHYPYMPVIMLSDKGQQQLDLQALRMGAVDYLIRGMISPAILGRSIRYALNYTQLKMTLKDSEDLSFTLFENVPIGLILLSNNGTIIQANTAFCELGGYTREEVTHRYCNDLLEITLQDLFSDSDQMSYASTASFITHFLHSSKQRIEVQLTVHQIGSHSNNSKCLVLVEDLQTLGDEFHGQQTQQIPQTQSIEHVLSQMTNNMTQEISLHVQTIRSRAEDILVRSKNEVPPSVYREIDTIVEQCASLNRLLGGVVVKHKQQLVTSCNFNQIYGQIRLRILREPNAAKFRSFLTTNDTRDIFGEVLQKASYRSALSAGIDEVKQWLWNYQPPLISAGCHNSIWSLIESVVIEALQQLRSSMASACTEAQIPPLVMSCDELPELPHSHTSCLKDDVCTTSTSSNDHIQVSPLVYHQRTANSSSPNNAIPSTLINSTPNQWMHNRDTAIPESRSSVQDTTQANKGSSALNKLPSMQQTAQSSELDASRIRSSADYPLSQTLRSYTPAVASRSTTKPTDPKFSSSTNNVLPTKEETPLPPTYEKLFTRIMFFFQAHKIYQWTNRKSFEAYIRRYLYRYQNDEKLPLDPLWETLHKIPGSSKENINEFFIKLIQEPSSIPLIPPVLLSDNSSANTDNQ
jgi:PAS domain S-box-containing protein